MIYPAFTENTEKGLLMYFPLENKPADVLISELSQVYYCYAAAGTAEKDGKKYVVLTVEDDA